MSKSEFRRLMIQDPERVYEELERLRRIEAAAKAWLDAEHSADKLEQDPRSSRMEAALRARKAAREYREALRKAIGGE